MQNNRIFNAVLSSWHILFRELLDQLTVHPNQLNKVEINCTIRGGNIIEFVKERMGKPRITEQKIRKENDLVQEKCDNLIDNFNANEVPLLMDGFRLIFVQTLEELSNLDKRGKTKTDTGNAKGINFWKYFNGKIFD